MRILAALAIVLVVATAGPAFAHASLVSTDPQAGAVLDTAPDAIQLSFTEPVTVSLGGVRVFDARR